MIIEISFEYIPTRRLWAARSRMSGRRRVFSSHATTWCERLHESTQEDEQKGLKKKKSEKKKLYKDGHNVFNGKQMRTRLGCAPLQAARVQLGEGSKADGRARARREHRAPQPGRQGGLQRLDKETAWGVRRGMYST